MSFENKNRVTDKNVGNHVQYKRNADFIRLRMQNLQKEAKMGASSSRNNERVESLEILKRRSGRTAPGSEIPLTGTGLLGGWNSNEANRFWEPREQRQARELAQRQAQELAALHRAHAEQRAHWRNNPNDRGGVTEEALNAAHIAQIAAMRNRHESENS